MATGAVLLTILLVSITNFWLLLLSDDRLQNELRQYKNERISSWRKLFHDLKVSRCEKVLNHSPKHKTP